MTIWLDVTTTLGWNRPALGILRVEAEIARQFLVAEEPGIRFCSFDRGAGGYVSVSSESVGIALERLDAGGQDAPPSKADPAHPATPLPERSATREQRAKRYLLGLMVRVPVRYRDRVYRFAHSRRGVFGALVRAYREARAAAALTWRGSHPPVDHIQPEPEEVAAQRPSCEPPFEVGDVYISLGLDWDQKDLVHLYDLKRRLCLKVLLFCYDVIPIRFPHLCVAEVAEQFPGYIVDAAWCADKILCISDCSRRDLRQFLQSVGAPVPPLDVVRLGCDLLAVTDVPPSPAVSEVLSSKFILFVSTIERRKNHETLYRAYTRLIDEGRLGLPLLVFVGMPGWGIGELMADLRLDPRIQSYLRILSHVSDGDLRRLYENARFTVYPSLYEGWGLPVAESLAHGKFCLASNAASIPEVAGDLIDYLDPWDVPGWADKLAWYFDHPDEVERREAEIRSRYRAANWQETGSVVLGAAEALQNQRGGLEV